MIHEMEERFMMLYAFWQSHKKSAQVRNDNVKSAPRYGRLYSFFKPIIAASGCMVVMLTEDIYLGATQDIPLAHQIHVIEEKYHILAGVYAWDARCHQLLTQVHGNHRFPLLSVSKIYIVADILAQHIDLHRRVMINQRAIVPYSPIILPAVGHNLTVEQLAHAALTASDNTASNYLLHLVGGPAEITRFARSLGDNTTQLHHYEPELNYHPTDASDHADSTIPTQFAHGLRALMHSTILSPHARNLLITWMSHTTTSDQRIRAGLPLGWTSADKTGSYDGYAHDVGFVYSPGNQKILLAIFTQHNPHTSPATDYNRDAPIAQITRAIIDFYQSRTYSQVCSPRT